MMNLIKIEVTGQTHSGKSTIAYVLAQLLIERGLDVELVDHEDDHLLTPSDQMYDVWNERMDAIMNKGTVVEISTRNVGGAPGLR